MPQSKAGYIDARPLTASSAKPLATHGRTIHSGQTATRRKDCVMSVLAPITNSVSTMRGGSYLPAPKEQILAPPNRPRLAENKRSGPALRSQCRRGDDVVTGPPEQQRHDGAV